jgi:glycosyltransferase involved in cell wall biosynthesis
MGNDAIPADALRASDVIKEADIVIGIPSYNNATTIGHVTRAACAGLAKYFPHLRAVIVNSDGGSKDSTVEQVLSAQVEDATLLLVSTPLDGVHRLSFPYHGIPGKGSAFRLVFRMAEKLKARACAVVDADLRSITPEWFDLLLRPILVADFDFVAPYYHRHKYDGTITNSIVYPLTRALYGLRVRQPIGGEFGVSRRLIERYLERDDWETDVARYGIDIWMTTIAIAEGYRVCQSFLGAKLHDAKDPGADLSAMLHQVVGSVFMLMNEYDHVWMSEDGSRPCDLFGFRFDVGLDPIEVNLERMLMAFSRGAAELDEVWSQALDPGTYEALRKLARAAGERPNSFHIEDGLWTRVVMDFACAYRFRRAAPGHLLRSLTPLYLARVASFVIETRAMVSSEVEQRIEELCSCFEREKPYLVSRWNNKQPVSLPDAQPAEKAPTEVRP